MKIVQHQVEHLRIGSSIDKLLIPFVPSTRKLKGMQDENPCSEQVGAAESTLSQLGLAIGE